MFKCVRSFSLLVDILNAVDEIEYYYQRHCGLFIAERTNLFLVKLGKGPITNRALKTKNPFSSVEGEPPLKQRQLTVPKKVVSSREALVKKLFSGVSGLNCLNTTTIYCAEESGAAEKLGEEVVLVSLELVVEGRED